MFIFSGSAVEYFSFKLVHCGIWSRCILGFMSLTGRFFQALQFSSLSQTLVDFEHNLNVSTAATSMILMFRGLTFLLGSLILGPVFEKIHHHAILSVTCAISAVTMMGMAFVQHLSGVLALAAVNGLANGVLTVGKCIFESSAHSVQNIFMAVTTGRKMHCQSQFHLFIRPSLYPHPHPHPRPTKGGGVVCVCVVCSPCPSFCLSVRL